MSEFPAPSAPVLYVSDLQYRDFDPADLFDLAFLRLSPRHDLLGVCLTNQKDSGGERLIASLSDRFDGGEPIPVFDGAEGLQTALLAAPVGVNLVTTGGFGVAAALLRDNRALFRQKNVRLFLVGGHANDYASDTAAPSAARLPIDPRLRERNPERFAPAGDPRLLAPGERAAWAELLTSGEGVIWLPRDICLWRYAAPGLLRKSGGPLADFLRRKLFWANLQTSEISGGDRDAAAEKPVLVSSLPAFLLAVQPDPFAWMRQFRVVAARVEMSAEAEITLFSTRTESPNLYAVVAIDGSALGNLMTATLTTATTTTGNAAP